VQPGGVMVKTLACDSRGREFNSRPFRGIDHGQVVHSSHICASVTKQYASQTLVV